MIKLTDSQVEIPIPKINTDFYFIPGDYVTTNREVQLSSSELEGGSITIPKIRAIVTHCQIDQGSSLMIYKIKCPVKEIIRAFRDHSAEQREIIDKIISEVEWFDNNFESPVMRKLLNIKVVDNNLEISQVL